MARTRHRHMTRHKIILISIIILLTGLTSFKYDSMFADDFLEFWNDVKDNYSYFDKKHTDWDKVKTIYLPQAQNTKNKNELITAGKSATAAIIST